MSVKREDLIGGWRLLRWETEEEGAGRVNYPFGADADGLIVYAPDGWMSAALWTRIRSPLSAASVRQADAASKARALEEYLSYCGRWTLEAGTVRHEVLGSLNPVLIGTLQLREARFRPDGALELGARERAADGRARVHRLLWRRA